MSSEPGVEELKKQLADYKLHNQELLAQLSREQEANALIAERDQKIEELTGQVQDLTATVTKLVNQAPSGSGGSPAPTPPGDIGYEGSKALVKLLQNDQIQRE